MGSYSVSDFVPFDAVAWHSLVNRYLTNDAALILPLTALLCIATVLAIHRRNSWFIYLMLAVCWAWLGLRFHGHWHTQLNWAAKYWTWAFVLQSVLMAGLLILQTTHRSAFNFSESGYNKVLIMLPWLTPPLIGLHTNGYSVWPVELAGATSDPTAWCTVLWLCLTNMRRSLLIVLSIIPLLSLALSLTLAVVLNDSPKLWIHVVALLSIGVALRFKNISTADSRKLG